MSVERADLQQPVPVGRVARQARDLQPQHDPGAAHADLGDQLLEALAVHRRGARLAEIGVDDDDRSRGQPSATARWRSAYWRWVLSVFSKTCRTVDCRT